MGDITENIFAGRDAEFELLFILLSSPFLWTPSKICDFFKKAWLHLKEKEDDPNCRNEKGHFTFKNNLNGRQMKQAIGASKWTEIFTQRNEERHHEIFVTRYESGTPAPAAKQRKYNGALVTSLLEIIRHKHEHWLDLTTAIKNELGWDALNYSHFSQFYAEYWNTRFPNLLIYLWIQFAEFSRAPPLAEFYPTSISLYAKNCPRNRHNGFPKNMNLFLEHVAALLYNDMAKGGLSDRYHSSNSNISVEFRIFPSDVLGKIIPKGASAIGVLKKQGIVKLLWGGMEATMTYSVNYRPLETYAFVVATSLQNIGKLVREFQINNDAKITFIVSKEANISDAMSCLEQLFLEFLPNPVNVEDLHVRDLLNHAVLIS